MASVTLLGAPWDEQSSFMRGAAAGPDAIRQALGNPSTNMSTESGEELVWNENLVDAGNVTLPENDPVAACTAIADEVHRLLVGGANVVVLGGDHAITLPVVRAHASRYPSLSILHLDAHPDMYDDFNGQPFSHASVFARILESGLAAKVVQVGIRTLNEPQRRHLERFAGVEQIGMRDWTGDVNLAFDGPFYLSLDLDVLDPAFMPGVSHHEPGGLSTRDVLRIIQRVQGRLVGADVVELNPSRDRDGVSAMTAAKLVKEIAARMLRP